jgi:hypothetical protein
MPKSVEGAVAHGVTYKIGRTYQVKHNKTTWTRPDVGEDSEDIEPQEYPAGVHLYKEPKYRTAMLKCRYSGAVAEDHQTVVAMRITPLEYGVFTSEGKLMKVRSESVD